jgi:Domain of Unknown Function (DUF748)
VSTIRPRAHCPGTGNGLPTSIAALSGISVVHAAAEFRTRENPPRPLKTAQASNSRATRLPRWLHRLLLIAVTLIVVVIAIDFIAAPIVRSTLNRRLSELPDHRGHVEKVNLSLWRGRCEIGDFSFFERGRQGVPPLLHVKRAALNLKYAALLRGKLSATAVAEKVELNVVETLPAAGAEKEKAGAGTDKVPAVRKAQRWQDALKNSFPVEITRLELKDARVRLIDPSQEPKVDVGLDTLHLVATGLDTRPEGNEGPLPARVEVEGVTTGNGRLKISVQSDPLAGRPRFVSQFSLRDLSLPALNPLLIAYADADVARGTFEFDSEIDARDGAYSGYVKPFFKDLDFKTASDKDKNAAQLLKKKVVTAVATLLKNDENKVATKAPFSGNFATDDVDVWTTIVNLLRNAFVQGLREGFEGQTANTGGSGGN